MDDKHMVHSVEKAFLLLNTVAAKGDWVGVRELARMTGMKPPTAQQLLKTLQKTGYLEFDEESRRYRIGIAAIMLGNAVDGPSRIAEFTKLRIDAIYEEFKETTAVLTVERGVFISVYWRQCQKELASAPPATRVIPNPHGMASSKVLLAYQSKEFISNYITEKRIQNPEAFEASLKEIRDKGYCELVNFNSSGVAAYGMNCFDATGKAVFSIGWSIPLPRYSDDIRDKALAKIKSSINEMGEILNFRKGII